jgi:hypothetical protein
VKSGSGVFRDRRVLFGFVGHQWLMIEHGFERDPGGPARKLSWIANRYAHDDPLDEADGLNPFRTLE